MCRSGRKSNKLPPMVEARNPKATEPDQHARTEDEPTHESDAGPEESGPAKEASLGKSGNQMTFVCGSNVETPNDPKLSDTPERRGACVVGGKAAVEAGAVTRRRVRCSAWLGVAVIGRRVSRTADTIDGCGYQKHARSDAERE